MSDQEFVDQVAEAITKALRQVSDVVGVSPPSDFDAHAAAEAAIAGLRGQMKKRNTCSCTCACCTVEPKWKPRVTHTRLSDGRVVPRGSQAAAIDQYGEGLVSYVADAGALPSQALAPRGAHRVAIQARVKGSWYQRPETTQLEGRQMTDKGQADD